MTLYKDSLVSEANTCPQAKKNTDSIQADVQSLPGKQGFIKHGSY